jgi:hypothetical protein
MFVLTSRSFPYPRFWQPGGRLDARYVQMNTGKGEVEERIPGLTFTADLPGPIENKVRWESEASVGLRRSID